MKVMGTNVYAISNHQEVLQDPSSVLQSECAFLAVDVGDFR